LKGAKGFTGRRGAHVGEEGVDAHEARALGRGRDAGDEHAHTRSFVGAGLARADEGEFRVHLEALKGGAPVQVERHVRGSDAGRLGDDI
jgi:hypothetical protein